MNSQTVHKMLLLDLQRFQTIFYYMDTAAEEEYKDRKIYLFLYSLEHFLSISSKISFLISYGILFYSILENTMENSHNYIVTQILFAMHHLTKSHIQYEVIIWDDFNISPIWHGKRQEYLYFNYSSHANILILWWKYRCISDLSWSGLCIDICKSARGRVNLEKPCIVSCNDTDFQRFDFFPHTEQANCEFTTYCLWLFQSILIIPYYWLNENCMCIKKLPAV